MQASEMIAERVIRTREETWEEETDDGQPLKRTLGIHFLGGATLDSAENYHVKKLFTALGALSIENQAAYDTARPSPVWGPRSGAAAPPRSSRTCRTQAAS
jgi:hypothetical protein